MVFVLDLLYCGWENVTEFQDKLLSLLIFYTDCYTSLSNPHLPYSNDNFMVTKFQSENIESNKRA